MTEYQLTSTYKDGTSKTETSDFTNILHALSIYSLDPDFYSAEITNLQTGEIILNICNFSDDIGFTSV